MTADIVLSSARGLADQAFASAAGAPRVSGHTVQIVKDAKENYSAWLDPARVVVEKTVRSSTVAQALRWSPTSGSLAKRSAGTERCSEAEPGSRQRDVSWTRS